MILAVDDDPLVRDWVRFALTEAGYAVLTAESVSEAIKVMEGGLKPSLILLDMMMPVQDGNDFLDYLLAQGDKTPVVLLTAYVDSLRQDLRPVPLGIVEKPISTEGLVAAVRDLYPPEG